MEVGVAQVLTLGATATYIRFRSLIRAQTCHAGLCRDRTANLGSPHADPCYWQRQSAGLHLFSTLIEMVLSVHKPVDLGN